MTQRRHRTPGQALALGALALLAGCSSLAPPGSGLPAELPQVRLPEHWRSPAPDAGTLPERWWRGFEDAALDRFIEQALHDSAQLASGLQRLRQARLKLRREGAGLKPEFSLSANAGLSQPLSSGGTLGQSAGLSAGLSYEVDVWGKLAAARSVAEFQAQASELDQQALALSLVGEVARQHWALALVNEQLSLLDGDMADTGWMLTIARVRHSAGAIPATEVTEIEQLLESLRLQRLELRRDRANARQSLALLLGTWPELPVGERTEVPRHEPPPLPAGLPADLLLRRPDVRAAEMRLRAQRRSVDVARAALAPGLSLHTTLDTSGEKLLRFLSNPVLSLGGEWVMPLLQSERLGVDLEISRSEAEGAAIEFRQSVLTALAEVESALQERAYLGERVSLLARSLSVAERAEKVARTRFEAGLSGALPWLEQRKQRRDAAQALAKGRRDLLAAQMQLYQALGGDTSLGVQALPNHASQLDGLPGVAPVRRLVVPTASESAPPKQRAAPAAGAASGPDGPAVAPVPVPASASAPSPASASAPAPVSGAAPASPASAAGR